MLPVDSETEQVLKVSFVRANRYSYQVLDLVFEKEFPEYLAKRHSSQMAVCQNIANASFVFHSRCFDPVLLSEILKNILV